MAVVAVIAIAAITVAAIVVAVVAMNKNMGSNDMAALGLDKFQITQCNEGEAIPLVWGTVKCSSNILWYGNLVSVKQKGEGGGKGGGGDDAPITGYRYYMDLWLGLCWCPNGSTTLKSAYIQDKKIGLSGLGTYILNPGNGSYYPPDPGTYANKLPGQAHITLDRYDLGVNTSFVPNISFVIQTTSSAPLTNANMSSGVNPAAVIYDLLMLAEVEATDIDMTSFQSAASYWYSAGYGLNIILNSQSTIEDHIAKLQTYVDFALYQNNAGKWILKPYKSSDVAVATINTEDVKDFTFTAQTWDSTFNDFRATFIDSDLDYTQRVITVDNVASINLIGHRIQRSLDLTAFNKVDVASKRLSELMKRMSYPLAQITCSVPYRFVTLNIGEVVELNNTDYGIVARLFRVISIEETDDANYVRLTLQDMLENKFDANYYIAGGGMWVAPDNEPRSPSFSAMFELPYTETFGTKPTWLFLCQRKGIETGFSVYQAAFGTTNFKFVKNLTSFSTRGVLEQDYVADTNSLDDEVGIYFTPHRYDPDWTTISRAELFNTRRIVIMGSEICTFQTIEPAPPPYSVGTFRLTGVCRGVLCTAIAKHNSGTEIWITEIADNWITSVGCSKATFKLVPFVGRTPADIATCTSFNATMELKAVIPNPVTRIKVVRSGTTCSVTINPSVYNTGLVQNSAGAKAAGNQTDKGPLAASDVYGTVEYKVGAGAWTDPATSTEQTFSYTQSGSHTLSVRYVWNNIAGLEKSIVVGASNGTYYGPTD